MPNGQRNPWEPEYEVFGTPGSFPDYGAGDYMESGAMPGRAESRESLYARAAMGLGLDVAQVESIWEARLGPTGAQGAASYDLWGALESHVRETQFGGGAIGVPGASMWTFQHAHAAQQAILKTALPLPESGEVPSGWMQYGQRMWPHETVTAALGVGLSSGGELSFGLAPGKEGKAVKHTRAAPGVQAFPGTMSGLPAPTPGYTMGSTADQPEMMQTARAFVSFDQPMAEGMSAYDPKHWGHLERPVLASVRLPKAFDVTQLVQPGTEFSGQELAQFFPGHTGERYTQYDRVVVNAAGVIPISGGEAADRGYQQLLVQMTGHVREGGPISQKAGVAKGGGIAMPVAEMFGDVADPVGRILGGQSPGGAQQQAPPVTAWFQARDIEQLAALHTRQMTPEQQTAIYGREVPKWDPDLYQTWHEKVLTPGMQETWLQPRAFNLQDPRTQARLGTGQLRETERIDEYTIMAQQKTVGIALELGMQQSMVWEHQKGIVPFEVAGEITRTHPEMAEYYSTLSRGRQRTLANIGGAAMFNVGQAEDYQTTPVGDLPWTSLTAQAMGRLEEQGVTDPMRALPGQLGQALMMEMGKEVGKGRGLMFPKPGGGQVAMPNPAAVEAYLSGAPVEGMRFGLPRAYTGLLGTYQKMQEGRATEKEYGAALTEAQTQLAKVTSSAGMSRRMTGWDVGSGALTGGRVAPTEGLPMQRFTAGREWLEQHMQFEPGLTGKERGRAVSDVMSGKEAFFAMAFRQPVSLGGLQMRSVLEYMGPTEAEKAMGLSSQEYKERFTSAVGVHPTWGAATQFGDFDVDPWAFLAASVVERDPETGRTKFRRLASGGLTEKDILGLAALDIGGEVGKDVEKIRAVQGIPGALAWAAERHTRITPERLTEISVQAEQERAQQGPVYNFAERQLRWGLKAAAEQATGKGATALTVAAEEMGKYYLGAQSRAMSLGEQEQEATRGFPRLLDIYRSASTASGGGISAGEGIYYQGQSGMIGAAFTAVSEMGELSTRSKAAMLLQPDLPGFERLQAIMEETASMEGGAKRGRLIGEAIGIVLPEQQQDFAQWAGRGVLGEILGGAASRRGYAEQLAFPEGKRTATGIRTTAMSPEAISLAGRGGARQGMLTTLYKAGLGQTPIEERVAKQQAAMPYLPAAERGLLRRSIEAMDVGITPTPSAGPPVVPSGRTPGPASPVQASTATTPDATWTKRRIYEWAREQGRTGRGGDIGTRQTKGQMLLNALAGPTVATTPAAETAVTAAPSLSAQAPGPLAWAGGGLFEEATGRITRQLGVAPTAGEAPQMMGVLAEYSRGGRPGGEATPLRQELNEMIAAHPGMAAQVQQVWQTALRPTGLTMDVTEGALAHQYTRFLQTRAGGGAAAGGMGAPPPAGGAGAGFPAGLGGGGQAGRGYTRFTRSATGEEFVTGSFTPAGGISQQQRAIMGAMEKYETGLSERAGQLREELASGKSLSKAARQTATVLQTYHAQMTQAVQQAKAAGLTGEQAAAAGAVTQLEEMGMPALGAQAQVQQQMMGMGVIQPPGQGAARAGQAFRSVFSGWEMMRMKRMWGMTGAPVFQQMIPAAAQAEIPGWQTTVAMGGFQPGMAPGGVAGGLMVSQAAQRQQMIRAGRTGYQAWGWSMGAVGGLKQAQAMFGPAAGVGAIAGSIAGIAAPLIAPGAVAGMGAAGIAGAISLPIALGVAGILGAVGVGEYAYQAGDSTAENAMRVARAREEGGMGGQWQLGMTRMGIRARITGDQGGPGPGLTAMDTQQVEARVDAAMQARTERGQELQDQPLAAMSATDRMAAINAAAQGLRQKGGIWETMDEGQISGLIGQFAAYRPEMTVEEIEAGPEWLEQAAVTGRTPQTFAPLAKGMGLGWQGGEDLYERWGGLPAGQLTQYVSAAEALTPLARFGIEGEQMMEAVEGGWEPPTGRAGALWGRMMGGSRTAWTEYGRETGQPGYETQDPTTGMPIGSQWGSEVLAGRIQAGQTGLRRGPGAGEPPALEGMEITINAGKAYVNVGGEQVEMTQWELRDKGTEMRQEERRWGAEQARGRFDLGQAYVLGTGQFEGRGQWDFQDQQRQMQWTRQQQQFGFAQEGLDMNLGQFMERRGLQAQQFEWQTQYQRESMGIQYGRQQTQFGWQAEDLAFRGAQTTMQYGWQMEDIQENLRYATGRQRRQLLKQQGRATIQFGMGMGQLDVQGERLEERREWAEEDHNRARRFFDQRVQWTRQEMAMSLHHFTQRHSFSQRRLDADKTYFEETFEFQGERVETEREYWETQQAFAEAQLSHTEAQIPLWEQYETAVTNVNDAIVLLNAQWTAMFEAGGPVQRAFQNVGALFDYIAARASGATGYNGTVQNDPYRGGGPQEF